MGDVIRLEEHRRAKAAAQRRVGASAARAEFFFDLACPFSYLAAERVDRAFAHVTWRPASTAALTRRDPVADAAEADAVCVHAELRAAELRMPLQWPDGFPAPVPSAMRVAAEAIEQRRGGAFIVAAFRLAFCGGFDLDDPEILAEAAAAAGMDLTSCLRAAGDAGRDGTIEAGGRRLLAVGADRLPALRVGRSLVWGEQPVASMATAVRTGVAALGR
jgi:2-hydroxychromene-2-carboxylate isomerase